MSAQLQDASAGPLRAEQVESFHRDGFIEVEDVFPDSLSRDLALAMLHLVRGQNCPGLHIPSFDAWDARRVQDALLDSLIKLESENHEYIRNVHSAVRESPALTRMIVSPAICGAVTQLMGLPSHWPLCALQRSCRIDMPGDTVFFLDWHQEVHYTFKDAELIQIWAPALMDITLENGAMRILPGSHKAGVARTNDRIPEAGHAQYTVVPEVVARFPEKLVTMRRGNALLFHKMLIHKSGVNSSPRPRLTLIAHYHNALAPGFFASIKPAKVVRNPYAS